MEGLTEIWRITFICLSMSNPECVKMNGIWGCCSATEAGRAFKYNSEERCVSSAEYQAERLWNEHRVKLEYICEKVATWEPYVATRRYRNSDGSIR